MKEGFSVKLGGEFSRTHRPFTSWGGFPIRQHELMIYFVDVQLKDIFEQGKDFLWIPPIACLRCRHYRVWGHGFVPRFFDGFVSCLYLKCYRCPQCRCVMTTRPETHFSRIRCRKETIRVLINFRITTGRWLPSSLSLPRMRHWLANLARQTVAHLTDAWKEGPIAAFDRLLGMSRVPVSRSI